MSLDDDFPQIAVTWHEGRKPSSRSLLGGVGDRVYGETPAKLRASTKAMKRAFGIETVPE